MNNIFKHVNNLFESDAPVTLTERGHKYIQKLPDDEIEGKDEGRSWRKDYITDTGKKINKGDISGYTKGRIFYDVIKHLAPTGYRFDVSKGWNGSFEISLIPEGKEYGTTIGKINIKVDSNDQPVATFEPSSRLEDLGLFNKRPRTRTVAKELAAEKGVEVNDDNIDEFMLDNSEEIKRRLDQLKSDKFNTLEGFVDAISKQLNKLPAGTLMKNISESEDLDDEEESDENKKLKAAIEILRSVPKYSPQWQAMVDVVYNRWSDREDTRKDVIEKFDKEDFWDLDDWDVSTVLVLAHAASSTVEDKIKEIFKEEIEDDEDLQDIFASPYYESEDNKDEKTLTEDWDASMPNWLKRIFKLSKKERGGYGLALTSESKIEEVPVPENLTKYSHACDAAGQLFILKVGDRALWFKDSRWRDMLRSDIFYSMEEVKDLISRTPEGNVKAAVVVNEDKAWEDKRKKNNDRQEARKGGIYRRSEVPKNAEANYDYSYGYGYRSGTIYDKSGYQINPTKYQDMLRTLNQKKLASSSVIDKLKTEDYVNKFNELGKEAAKFIGDSLNIAYKDGGKYDSFEMDTSVVDNIKTIAENVSYEIRKLMRRVDYVKSGDESDLDYYETPEREGVYNLDKWLKDQMKVVDKKLKEFEKSITDVKKAQKIASDMDESENLGAKQKYTKEQLLEYAKVNGKALNESDNIAWTENIQKDVLENGSASDGFNSYGLPDYVIEDLEFLKSPVSDSGFENTNIDDLINGLKNVKDKCMFVTVVFPDFKDGKDMNWRIYSTDGFGYVFDELATIPYKENNSGESTNQQK